MASRPTWKPYSRAFRPIFLGMLSLALAFVSGTSPEAAPKAGKTSPGLKAVTRRYAALPLAFARNEGQFSPQVKFAASGNGYSVLLTRGGADIEFRSRKSEVRSQNGENREPSASSRRVPERPDDIHLRLVATTRAAELFGLDEQAGKSNYFIGRNPRNWRTNVPLFGRVEYSGVYRGIGLIYHGNQQRLEYDFVVNPESGPSSIRMAITAGRRRKSSSSRRRIKALRISASGDLVIETMGGEVRFRKPIAYQEGGVGDSGLGIEQRRPLSLVPRPLRAATLPRLHAKDLGQGTKDSVGNPKSKIQNLTFVPARYVLLPNNEFGFKVGAYDRSKPLVIDPVLDYSTYFGGTGFDYATGIAVDSAGNAYITGYTTSADLPVASPLQSSYSGGTCNNDMSPSPCFDAFVAKLNAQGTALVYATYLGGSGDDRAMGIAVDSAGEAFVGGYTGSSDFPVVSAFQNAIGGGSCGSTTNPYPCYDAFAAKLSASGSSLIYSTYLGGSGDDYGTGIAIDSSLDAYVTGFTSGGNFPVTSGAMQPSFGGGPYDGFVSKLGPTGSTLVYSTFLGGSGEDRAAAIAVDSSGDAYVAGQTVSTNFPVQGAFQPAYAGGSCGCFDAFVPKLNPAGSAAVYSTYLGGTGGDYGNAIAVDSGGEAYIAGWTTSTDFPVTSGAFQQAYAGSDDAFVTKLSAAGNSLVYSTYLGGIDPEVANGLAIDASGDALITGSAYGTGFPALDPLQASSGGFYDAFVAALNPEGSALLYATLLGGSGDDYGNAIAADASGNAFVAGGTFSTDFPTTPGSLATSYTGGAYDAFAAEIAPGNAPGLTVFPNPVMFGDQEVGSTSSAQTIELMNAGSGALSLSSVNASGDFAVKNNCPASIPGGTSCSLGLIFAPTETGTRQGALGFTDNATGSPQSVPLDGFGTSGAASLSTTSLDFGSVEAGTISPPQTVTLQNTGGAPLAISSIQATGDYSQSNNCGTSLATGADCTITVSFSPVAPGASVGEISIADTAPGSPQAMALSGTGVAPGAALSASSLTFGNQPIGTTSSAQSIALSNPGSAPLNISAIGATADFSETNDCGASLAIGSKCTINISFAPMAAGPVSGTLTVTDNAAGSPQGVALSGTGTSPGIEFSPPSLNFGNVNEGATSTAQGVTITNDGSASLMFSGISTNSDFPMRAAAVARLRPGPVAWSTSPSRQALLPPRQGP